MTFRFADGQPMDVDIEGWHQLEEGLPMSVQNPSHPAAGLRDDLEEVGWTVGEFAARLGVSRNTASRLLNGRCSISPRVALALERIGWSNADFWIRRQSGYDLAMARRGEEAVAVAG